MRGTILSCQSLISQPYVLRTDVSTQNLSRENNCFQDDMETPITDPSRVLAENHATDSYQNVLFSILRFRQATGVYPRRVTVVTHEFKRARFMECHFPAVGLLPIAHSGKPETDYGISVIGINPPEEVTPMESLLRGEAGKGIGLWRQDLYGTSKELGGKRALRGWENGKEAAVFESLDLEEVVEQLTRWKSGSTNELFPRVGELPWFYGERAL